MIENKINGQRNDTSDVLSLLQTIDQLYQVSCSVLNDHTQTSLRMSIAIEAQMLLSKLKAMNRRWKLHLPFKEACNVDFFDWSERMSEISKEIAASTDDNTQRKFEKYCPSKHFMLDLYAILHDEDSKVEKPYYEETDIKKFIERQELMRTYVTESWKKYVTDVSDKTVQDLASRDDADIELSYDAVYVQTICCKVLEELSEALYSLNQRLTSPISRKDFTRLADRILIEGDYGGNYALTKAKAKVFMWSNKTPYDRKEAERDEKIKEVIAELEKTKYGGLFMQNVKIYKDFYSQRDSFGKFLFSVRSSITKDELSKLFELIFQIYHLRIVLDQLDQDTDDTKVEASEQRAIGQIQNSIVNPPLPVEFSQNFRCNDEAVAKFFELLRKVGPYINRKRKKNEEHHEASMYSQWQWGHLEDALIRLKLLVSDVNKTVFAHFIHTIFPDRSSDSVQRALYRTNKSTHTSIVGDVMKFFQPVKSIVDKALSED